MEPKPAEEENDLMHASSQLLPFFNALLQSGPRHTSIFPPGPSSTQFHNPTRDLDIRDGGLSKVVGHGAPRNVETSPGFLDSSRDKDLNGVMHQSHFKAVGHGAPRTGNELDKSPMQNPFIPLQAARQALKPPSPEPAIPNIIEEIDDKLPLPPSMSQDRETPTKRTTPTTGSLVSKPKGSRLAINFGMPSKKE